MVKTVPMYRRLKAPKFSDVFIWACCLVAIYLCLAPLVNVIALSFSANNAIVSRKVSFWPVGFNLLAFGKVYHNAGMVKSFYFTIILTVVYTVLSMVMTILCAYPLSKKHLRGHKVIWLYIIFTMYFSGGMIPIYMQMQSLKLLDNFWVLVLPGLLSTFNMIILKSYFSNSIPQSLIESAKLDGCGDMRTLLVIVLPLSTSVLATLSLFYAVGKWNTFSDALLYIKNQDLYPLQLRLYQLIFRSQLASDQAQLASNFLDSGRVNSDAIKAASIVVTTIPIILVYPWLQKYFVKGVLIGAVKG
jgi:putative aldouronate transport system permease protein